ncbi:hypothetical protein C8R42DRAFT_585908, partial [Lentinula raphanica]
KLRTRAETCQNMIQVSKERNNTADLDYYRQTLALLNHLGAGGMSEEENDSRSMVINNRQKTVQVKTIKVMLCRHTAVGRIFADIDDTREREAHLFSGTGKQRMPRIRVPEVSTRKMGPKLSFSVWRPEFLNSQQPFQLAKLEIDPNPFHFYERQPAGNVPTGTS